MKAVSCLLLAVLLVCVPLAAQEPPPPPPGAGALAGDPLQMALQVDRLLNEGKYAEARTICQQVYDTATDSYLRAVALRAIGETYKEADESDRALATYQRLLAEFPQSDQVPWALAGMIEAYYVKAGTTNQPAPNLQQAIAAGRRFLKDYPRHERASYILLYLGRCYRKLGDDLAALAEFQRAVTDFPGQKFAEGCLQEVIGLQQKLGRWEEAIASARRYLELFPGRHSASAQMAIAFAYVGKGNLEQAAAEFARVPAQYPAQADLCAWALYQKASCEQSMGQAAAARATLEQLVRDHPGHSLAQRAQAQLAAAG